MSPKRRIVAVHDDPQSVRYRLYELDCGHRVRRVHRGDKRYALCGFCRA